MERISGWEDLERVELDALIYEKEEFNALRLGLLSIAPSAVLKGFR